jgi:starvation-inducible DNA-binding protein
MKPTIGISDQHREAVVKILNTLLSDEYVLYTKTRNFHWNVVGPQFHDFHKFFEAQYDEIDAIIDEVAERARMLGGLSSGSLGEFLDQSRLKEQPAKTMAAKTMVSSLLSDHEAIIQNLRKDLVTSVEKHHDMGTSDFLTGLMEQHEKMAWMLRATLEQRPQTAELPVEENVETHV